MEPFENSIFDLFLQLAGNYVKNMGHQVISMQDIKLAMCADKVRHHDFFNICIAFSLHFDERVNL